MISAEEYLRINFELEITKDRIGYVQSSDAYKAMIEFARLHVEAALDARDRLYQTHFDELSMMWTKENKEFIKNSYPLTNIK